MTSRMQFKVDMQEELLRKENGEIFKKNDDNKDATESKRLSEFLLNPQKYMDAVSAILKQQLHKRNVKIEKR